MAGQGRVSNTSETVYSLLSSYIKTSMNFYYARGIGLEKFYTTYLKRAFEEKDFKPLKLVPPLLAYKDSRLERIAALVVKDFYKSSNNR